MLQLPHVHLELLDFTPHTHEVGREFKGAVCDCAEHADLKYDAHYCTYQNEVMLPIPHAEILRHVAAPQGKPLHFSLQ